MLKTETEAFAKLVNFRELTLTLNLKLKRCVLYLTKKGFYECLHLLNTDYIENRDLEDYIYPVSIPKDYFQTASGICYLGNKVGSLIMKYN